MATPLEFCATTAVAFVIGALTQRGQGWREKLLWSGAFVSLLASAGLLLTQWRPQFSLSLDALLPVVTVLIVALMVTGRRPKEAATGLSRADIEKLVQERVPPSAEPKPLRPDQDPQRQLIAAIEALAVPVIAKAELDRLRSITLPEIPDPSAFANSDPSRMPDWLYQRDIELMRRASDLGEFPDSKGLFGRLAADEAEIKADVKYYTPQPDDPIQWPSMELKRKWHIVSQKRRLVGAEIRRLIAAREPLEGVNSRDLAQAIKSLKEIASRKAAAQ